MYPSVTLYGASWCMPCAIAKQKLTEAGIPFVYIDVDKEPYPEWVMSLPAYAVDGRSSTQAEVLSYGAS